MDYSLLKVGKRSVGRHIVAMPLSPQTAVARLLFVVFTIVVAFSVSYVVRYDLGFSREAIRHVALISAFAIGSLLIVGYFGRKRTPK